MNRRLLVGGSIAAFGTVALTALRLGPVDRTWWIARDDAVITLSHARNLVLFGSVGVSPGDRVEGFSSPLQFLLAAGILAVRDLGFVRISLIIAVASVLGIGFLSFVFLVRASQPQGPVSPRAIRVAGLATLVFVLGMVSHWTSLGWVVSGMENAVSLLLLVAVLVSWPLLRRGLLPSLVPSVFLGLLAIARVEFAAFVLPLLALFVLDAMRVHPDNPVKVGEGLPGALWRAGRVLAPLAPALLIIGSVHVIRRGYFGAWLPNTAVVQDRFGGVQQVVLLGVLSLLWCSLVFLLRERVSRWRWLAGILLAVSSVVALWMVQSGRAAASLGQLSDLPGFVPLVVLVVLLTVAQLYYRRFDSGTTALFVSLLFVPIGQYLVMGPARMDGYRILSLALPLLFLWVSALLVGITADGPSATEIQATVRSQTPAPMVIAALWLLGAGVAVSGLASDPARYLNWGIEGYTEVLSAGQEFRDGRLPASALPIVANPDLGKISYHKEVLMVDLGWLGDPVMAGLWESDKALAIDYLNRIARPDVVEIHGWWGCEYASYLRSPDFLGAYRPTSDRWMEGEVYREDCPFGARYIIWERHGDELEYELVWKISEADDPVAVISQALNDCVAAGSDPLRCQPVRRAVHRSILELQESGHWHEAISAFSVSPTAELDIDLLERGPLWADRVEEQVKGLLGTQGSS